MIKEALKLALEALEPVSTFGRIGSRDVDTAKAQQAIAAIKEALAQPEQEPVATLDDLEQEIYENTRQFVSRDVMEWMLKRYYTTPPQRTWVYLTNQEHEEIAIEWGCLSADWVFYAAAVERKVKEKNT